ncbi:hypothetical protein I4U23_010180 [Adineta vaga]|nr:hypothetical protein I4U23_010180 [Adineta vaga]
MCLRSTVCQMVMYNSTENSCTIYNSMYGILNSFLGHVIYTTNDSLVVTDQSEETTTKKANTETPTTCVTGEFPSFDTDLIALWRFDHDATDAKGSYHGTMMNGALIDNNGYINAAIHLAVGSSSHIVVPYISLSSTSFTIELWIRPTTPDFSMILISQNDLTLRVGTNGIVSISEELRSSGTHLGMNRWYHIALIYNHNLGKQEIYINGKLDSTFDVTLVSTENSSFYIGSLYGTSEFFEGQIDHVSITTRIKSLCEISNDASLFSSFSFTNPQVNLDSGPYENNGVITGSMYNTAGRVGDGFSISTNVTYFQTHGMTSLTTSYSDFSFTFFILPYLLRDCVLIYLSGTTGINDTSQARPYLGLSASGNIIAELPTSFTLEAPTTIPVNEWSHIAFTFSFSQNNVSLYYNGSLQISVPGPGTEYMPTIETPPIFVTLGNPLAGRNGTVIQAQPYYGSIDEFKMWSRALDTSEIAALANPN